MCIKPKHAKFQRKENIFKFGVEWSGYIEKNVRFNEKLSYFGNDER